MPEFPQKESEIIALADAVETEITLTDQPRLVELEYRIIGANKAGDLSACGHAQAESEPCNARPWFPLLHTESWQNRR